jgi:ribosomal protein S21
MMWDGKKSTAQGIFYQAMTNLEQKGGDEALKLFKKAVENCKPLLEVKTRRVGGANYQVPIEVQSRAAHLARHPLAGDLRPGARRKGHDRQVDQRTAGCGQRPRRGHEEEGGCPSHGRGEQGICALPLVIAERSELLGQGAGAQQRA